MKKWLCLLALALLIPVCASASPQERVFLEGETEPFPEDAALLTLRVCPLVSGDCMLLTLGGHSMLVDADTSCAKLGVMARTVVEAKNMLLGKTEEFDGFIPENTGEKI